MLGRDLFKIFAQSYDPPHWIVEDLLRNGQPGIQSALAAAIGAIQPAAINALDHDSQAQAEVMFVTKDADLQARLYLFSREAAQSIGRARLAAITDGRRGSAAAPYDHPALAGIPVDDEGLVSLGAFELNGDALCVNGHSFFVLLPVPGSNANYWLLQQFRRNGLTGAVRVRLDPLLYGTEDRLGGRFYRMDVYGRPLDWDRIQQLRSPDHGKWIPGNMSLQCLFTEYAWLPRDNEVAFICEELPRAQETSERGSRYLHAVYDKPGHHIRHLDGAVRVYTADALAQRAKSHVRSAGKTGIRIKVFRTDRIIDPDLMGDLAQAFFIWNYDVARYFGAPVPDDF